MSSMRRSSGPRGPLRVFGGSSHPDLTLLVSKKVGVRVGSVHLSHYSNGETRVELLENVRGAHVYLLQTGGSRRPNDDLMQLLLLIQAFKTAAAADVTLITPYFPYSKGDQKAGHRVPITCKLVADLVERAGASHVMLLDPHTSQLEGFFASPVDALKVEPLFCDWITHNVPKWHEAIVVSPDEGAVKRNVGVANDLGLDFAMIHSSKKGKKRLQRQRIQREEPDDDGLRLKVDRNSRSVSSRASICSYGCLNGSVEGRSVIMIDDMIDTGKTMRQALQVVHREGATEVYFMATHGLLASEEALANIKCFETNFLKAVVVTNSIDQKQNEDRLTNLHVVDVSGLIAEYVRRHHYKESVSVLSQFMPVVDEQQRIYGQDHDEEDEEDESDDNRYQHDEISQGATGVEELNEAKAIDKRLHSFRKGFRLSSVCWD